MRTAAIASSLALVALCGVGAIRGFAQQAATPPTRVQFVACPIVRDTKTQPCWLAEYDGRLYYLGQQSGVANDFYPPQLGHEALVEGTVGQGRVCGGIPLASVKVSVFRELTPACRTMLPAEDGIEAPPPVPAPRGPAPSWLKVGGPGEVTLFFDFDSDFFSFHVTVALTDLAKRAVETKAGRVEVTGYRAATRLSNGTLLTEREGLGRIRARKVADTLVGLGVPAGSIAVDAPSVAQPADGINDPWNRRVELRLR